MASKTVWIVGGVVVAIGVVAYVAFKPSPANTDAGGTIVEAKRAISDGASAPATAEDRSADTGQKQADNSGRPKEQADNSGRPKEQADNSGRPKEQADNSGRPKEQADNSGRPKEQADNSGRPKEQADLSSRPR